MNTLPTRRGVLRRPATLQLPLSCLHASALQPKHPLDLAAQISAPVLGLYGGQDAGIPLTAVDQMKAALADAGSKGNAAAKASEFVIYPDAPHAFRADYRPSFRKEAAEDGFKRALAWFKTHGVA